MFEKIYQFISKKKREKHIEQLVTNGLRIGNNVGILDGCFLDPSHCYLISIGDNCVLCPNVRMIAHIPTVSSPARSRTAATECRAVRQSLGESLCCWLVVE